MIVQDSLTGALHQVPDQFAGYGGYADYGDVVYDGYGNPLGFPPLAALLPLAMKAAPMAAKWLQRLKSHRRPAHPPPPVHRPPVAVAPAPPPPRVVVIRRRPPARPVVP